MAELRKAKTGDIALIRQLAEQSWRASYSEILSQEQIRYMLNEMYGEVEIQRHLANENYHYYIIENIGSAVGFIGFEHYYEPATTKLHRIYLIPEAKGGGFGKLALDFLKKKTSESGDSRIILNVNKQNGAQQFYVSQGFRVYDEGVFDIGNGFSMDDYLMEYQF